VSFALIESVGWAARPHAENPEDEYVRIETKRTREEAARRRQSYQAFRRQ